MMVIPSSDHTRQCGNLFLQRNQRRAKRLYKLKWLKFVQTPFLNLEEKLMCSIKVKIKIKSKIIEDR